MAQEGRLVVVIAEIGEGVTLLIGEIAVRIAGKEEIEMEEETDSNLI